MPPFKPHPPKTTLTLLLTITLGSCTWNDGKPLPLAQHVNLTKMYGGWYIVATMPNFFDNGLLAPYDVYSPGPNHTISEDFYTKAGKFTNKTKHFHVKDWVVPNTGNARWRVQLFWPLSFPFLILHVDPNYQHVMFGYPNRRLGWIYARKPTISQTTYDRLRARFKADGYQVEKMRLIPQFPAQRGEPGFLPAN